MPDNPTPEELAAWRELCEKATPDWEYDSYNTIFSGEKIIMEIPDHPDRDSHYEPSQTAERSAWYQESAANAMLAVAARTAFPRLLDALEAAEREREEAKAIPDAMDSLQRDLAARNELIADLEAVIEVIPAITMLVGGPPYRVTFSEEALKQILAVQGVRKSER